MQTDSIPRSTRREFLRTLTTSSTAMALPWSVRADARIKVKIAQIESLPITYPVAVVKGARPSAARFVEFLGSDAALQKFSEFGFLTLR